MEGNALAKLSVRLSERLKIKTNLGFNIDFALPGDLPRYTQKSRRFKDLRNAAKCLGANLGSERQFSGRKG